jgi:hypothetical protein
MMVYNTRDYWIFGLCPSCGIIKNTLLLLLSSSSSSSSTTTTTTTTTFPQILLERSQNLRVSVSAIYPLNTAANPLRRNGIKSVVRRNDITQKCQNRDSPVYSAPART